MPSFRFWFGGFGGALNAVNRPSKNTETNMRESTKTFPVVTRLAQLLTLLILSMSWSGCSGPKIIAADQLETQVEAGRAFTPPSDGWFLNDARYQRYRRAVADRILELEKGAK